MANTRGTVADGFEPVTAAFEENFTRRAELGASFAAYLDGEPVVDVWGGVADPRTDRPWQEDTTAVLFSGTKGLTALCVAMLIDRGLLDHGAPVAEYWPEFAANGKERITVAEALSHRARVPGLRSENTVEQLFDRERMIALLADQPPETDPRAAFAYHALTYGWICDALCERVDGRPIGTFFAEEVAAPLGLELWIGLPAELESRVAWLTCGPDWGNSPEAQEGAFEGDELWASIYERPPLLSADNLFWNEPGCHQAVLAGSNGVGTARSVARLYGALARGGELDGVRLLSAEALHTATRTLVADVEPFAGEEMRFGAGFQLQSGGFFGPVARAFGHGGAGGTNQGAWPVERVGFCYLMNEMRDNAVPDERVAPLLAALHSCIEAQ